jgi:hypothetical protein
MNPDNASDQTAALRARLVTLVGAIASSVGVVGFVTVVGGMVVWIRFDSLRLPADTVVAAIPRTTLIVIGLSTLIPFIALGLFAVLVAYLFAADNLVPSHPWRNVGSAWSRQEPPASSGLSPASIAPATAGVQSEQDPCTAELSSIVQKAGELQADASSAAEFGRTKVVAQRREQLKALQTELASLHKRIDARDQTAASNDLKEQAELTKAVLDQALSQICDALATAATRSQRVFLTWVLTILGLALIELGIVFLVGAPSYFQDLLLFGLGALLALVTLSVGLRTHGFTVFGAAIFVSILMFGTGATLLRIYHEPEVQPTAVLRMGHDAGLTGYFVADTSESVYLVRIAGKQNGTHFEAFFPRLVVVPRANVVSMEVGPFERQQQAYGTGYSELRELCGQKIAEAPAAKGTPNVTCGEQPGLVNPKSPVKKNKASGKKGQQASRKK